MASDVIECCLLARPATIDVKISVSVDQEFASMCLRLHKRKKRTAEIVLWESPPGADVLLAARHHPAASRTSLLALASVVL